MSQQEQELRNVRQTKLALMKENGLEPYPASLPFVRTSVVEALKNFSAKGGKKSSAFGVGGRIMAKRGHGGSMFLDVFDGFGKMQIFVAKDRLGKEQFELFAEVIDVGDFAAFWGKPFYTKSKEPTMEVHKWAMLSKSLLPLPEKWHGLQDIEERFRKRYLDILMNEEVRNRFLFRSKLVRELRKLLEMENYIEVETPILQPLYGGALAEPFKTHHRMLDLDMYLRIAPELYLKRLLAGGFSKIYEIGKNFRNEGLDNTHNPEFTTIELYEAYRDAGYLKKFIAGLLGALVRKLKEDTSFKFAGHTIKFKKDIPEIAFWKVIERYASLPKPETISRNDFALYASRLGIKEEKHESKEKIADEIFKKVCRPKLIQPIFVVDYPIAVSPLAKNHISDAGLVDRFQLIMGGVELANGFSELNDPFEQRARIAAQEEMKKAGEKETAPMDEEFLEMMEYGMPPAAGIGLSIDRLTMLLTDTHNIKEVILFPTMKPKL